MPLGKSRIEFGSVGFPGPNASAANLAVYKISAFGVGTETYAATIDESGGIIALGTGASSADNAVLTTAAKFAPRDGTMVVRGRFKYDANTTIAVWFGWTETLDTTTPVMPSEFSTATMTYNGSGGMVGLSLDTDATTLDFRACMGDGGAAISDSGNGTRANVTTTADRWFESEVILNTDGSAECWLGDSGHANSNNETKLRLIKRFDTGTLLTTTDLFYPCLMVETRTTAASTIEVIVFEGYGFMDWRY